MLKAHSVKSLTELIPAFLAVSFGFIYIFLVFERLDDFPLYFFCDEAINSLEAWHLLENGKDSHGKDWPVVFEGLGTYSIGLSVYLNIPLVRLLGLTQETPRVVNALVSIMGVLSVFFLLSSVFRFRDAWLAFPFFLLTPQWFLHSRTGFEVLIATALYLFFLLTYVLGMHRRAGWLLAAVVGCAGVFYSYTPGRGWALLGALFLLLANLRAHWQLRKRSLLAAAFGILLLIPYLSFHVSNPEAAITRLTSLGFAQFENQPLSQKIQHIGGNVAGALNPGYWFEPRMAAEGDGARHIIPDYGMLPYWMAPLSILGLILILSGLNRVSNRAILALFLAAPIPASLVSFNHLRTFPVGIFYLLFALIGAAWSLKRLENWKTLLGITRVVLAGALAIVIWQFRSYVFNEAPKRYDDYRFYGLQMGAPQLFSWLRTHSADFSSIVIAEGTFNAAQVFWQYFEPLSQQPRYKGGFLEDICKKPYQFSDTELWIFYSEIFERVKNSGCPVTKTVLHDIQDPNGNTIIEFALLTADSSYDKWVKDEENRRKTLQSASLRVGGDDIILHYPPLGSGTPQQLVDNNPDTLIRVEEKNPARFKIEFPAARRLRSVSLTPAHHDRLDIKVYTELDGTRSEWGMKRFVKVDKHFADVTFDTPSENMSVKSIEIEVTVPDAGERSSPHVAGISWE